MNIRKCTVLAKANRKPVDGTSANGMGTCPECLTTDVKLSKKGFIGSHNVSVDVDPTLPVVATGSPKGDPRDADVRRAVQVRKVAAKSLPVPEAPRAPEGRDEGESRTAMQPGPPLVRGRNMRPMASDVARRKVGDPEPEPQPMDDVRKGWAALAGTMHGPTGRDRMDRESSTVVMHGGPYGYLTEAQYAALSRSQQRKYWARIKRMQDDAAARRKAAVKTIPSRFGTGGVGGSSFTQGDSRETERIMKQARS